MGIAPIPAPAFCPAPKAIDAWVCVCVRSWPVKDPAIRNIFALTTLQGGDAVTAPVLLLFNRLSVFTALFLLVRSRSSSGPGSRRAHSRARNRSRPSGRFRGTGLSPSVLLLLNAACLPAAESGTAANPDRSAVETKNALPHRRLFVSGTALCVLCSCLACRTWWRFWSPRSWAGLLARLRPSLPLPQLVPLILPHSVYSCFGVGSWYIL